MTPDLRDRLAGEVADRMRMGHVLSCHLVDLLSAEIIASEDRVFTASLEIRFVSRMIVVLTGADGAVLAGNPVHVRILSEVWTLQRCGSVGGIWLLSAMEDDE